MDGRHYPIIFSEVRMMQYVFFPWPGQKQHQPDNYGGCQDEVSDSCVELDQYCLGEIEFLELLQEK